MVLGLLIKLAYTFVLWRWILPLFRSKRLSFVLPALIIVFISFISIEVFLSWQFKVFTVQHMVTHTSPVIWGNLVAYLVITLIATTIFFVRETLRNERLKAKLIESQLSTELKFLKAQVNPHFLFNTLNNLFSIAQRNKDDETANGISKLSGLMRYMLYDSAVSKVTLEKEIRNIKDYIILSKLRYSKEEAIVDLSETGEIQDLFIAPMILLPFIENAFKHGVDIEKTTTITISIKRERNKIIFSCTNPVIESSDLMLKEYGGVGLENVKRRLSLLYPGKHKLVITDTGNDFSVYLELESLL